MGLIAWAIWGWGAHGGATAAHGQPQTFPIPSPPRHVAPCVLQVAGGLRDD